MTLKLPPLRQIILLNHSGPLISVRWIHHGRCIVMIHVIRDVALIVLLIILVMKYGDMKQVIGLSEVQLSMMMVPFILGILTIISMLLIQMGL